jgi:quercetin dioxygenase-like cupin family protein
MFEGEVPAVPTLQHEDDAVRITRWDFGPGAVTGWHKHGWPYFIIMLKAGTLAVHNGSDISEAALAEGQAYLRAAGVEHDVRNASPHPIAFVEIEIKKPEVLSRMMLAP